MRQTNESVTLTRDVEALVVPTAEEARMPALQGRQRLAQGNALGQGGPFVTSPVRAIQNHRTTCSARNPRSVSPFQGLFRFSIFPQGVALGYLIPPRWG